MEPEKNQLDQWLDQALNDYGRAEPRLGLETRILARLATEKTRLTRQTLWPWAFANLARALAVVVAIWAWMSTQKSPMPSTHVANNNPALQKEPAVRAKSDLQVPTPPIGKRGVRRQVAKAPPLAKSPRLSQFPSVRELSTQEQLLARYAREFPQQALEVAQAQAAAEQERISRELARE
jgi:hypothetical protein